MEPADQSPADKAGADDLSARIARARQDLEPESGPNVAQRYALLSTAWRMTIELVAGAAIGFGIGWGLDLLFGSRPLFLIIFGLLGLVAGMKVVIETAQSLNKSQGDSQDGGSTS